MNTLAESYGDLSQPDRIVGWKEYVTSKNDVLRQLDEAVYEYAHFVAGLTAVDGAVILTQRHELIGFGAVILGPSDKVEIARSLDSEGDATVLESMDGVGMRHRAVYHLCNELHDAIAMIISHRSQPPSAAGQARSVVSAGKCRPRPMVIRPREARGRVFLALAGKVPRLSQSMIAGFLPGRALPFRTP